MINAAKEEYAKGNFENSLRLFQEEQQKQSDNNDALEGVARSYYRLKRFDDAVIFCNQALLVDKSLAWPYLILSYINYLQKRFDQSKQNAKIAFERDTSGWETNFWWGTLLDLDYKTDDGLVLLERALETEKDTWFLEKDAWYLYNSLSAAYFNKGNLNKYYDALARMNAIKPSKFNSVTIHLGRWAILYSFFLMLAHYIMIIVASYINIRTFLVIPFLIDALWLIGGGWYVYRHHYKTGITLVLFGIINSVFPILTYISLNK